MMGIPIGIDVCKDGTRVDNDKAENIRDVWYLVRDYISDRLGDDCDDLMDDITNGKCDDPVLMKNINNTLQQVYDSIGKLVPVVDKAVDAHVAQQAREQQ